ncbi:MULTISPECIES: AlpA family phage regulatory protein [unclassified Stenotrophomonas]|uniref:helix-turn-helix transcriptional regulator n=1 Tax=unclassified Stenotrophomonas TaxID=196198 RepID=UPI0025CD45A8|nr:MULTISPECIES: AlpA family phage regulatory protein [unclassified Stenotrophomonas]
MSFDVSTANRAPAKAPLSKEALSSASNCDALLVDQTALRHLEAILQSLQGAPALDQAIRLPEVLSIVGLSKSTWYARLNSRLPAYDARAPKPFKLGTSDRSPTAWWRSEVMAYVLACAAAQPAR